MDLKKMAIIAPTLALLALPLVASAHQVSTFKIGDSYYQFVVGSLNEPIVVDDKTGIDLTVTKCYTAACTPTRGSDGDMDGPAGTPVAGLDQTLTATLIAGGKKKQVSLAAQYGKPGAYTAPFYFTVATSFSYEFTGTVNNVPVDLTFACLPDGTPKAPLDTTEKKISDTVTQTSISGGFGCPLEKASLGFPEDSKTLRALSDEAGNSRGFAIAALALGALALALTFRRR